MGVNVEIYNLEGNYKKERGPYQKKIRGKRTMQHRVFGIDAQTKSKFETHQQSLNRRQGRMVQMRVALTKEIENAVEILDSCF